MDSNAAAGTDCTISVRALLEEAPDITTIEELRKKGRRDWKKQIKEKLEQALNKNISPAPLLKRWEYRSPSTGARYTPAEASTLSWDEYITLMVDFTMVEEPDQEARRAARANKKKVEELTTPPLFLLFQISGTILQLLHIRGVLDDIADLTPQEPAQGIECFVRYLSLRPDFLDCALTKEALFLEPVCGVSLLFEPPQEALLVPDSHGHLLLIIG